MSEPTFFKIRRRMAEVAGEEPRQGDGEARRLSQGRIRARPASPTSRRSTRRSASAGSTACARGGDATWQIRFTPRRKKSIWSQVNIKRVGELKAEGRMHPAGHRRLRGARPGAAEPLFRREPRRRLRCGGGADVPRKQTSLGELQRHAAVLPPAGDVVGGERKEGGDTRAPPRDADRQLARRTPHQADDSAEAKDVTRPLRLRASATRRALLWRACGRG